MRILVAALGSPGHTFPVVPLALALRDAGHAVTVATGDDVGEGLVSGVRGAGLDVLVTGPAFRDAFGPALARRGLTERPTDPTVMREVAGEVFGSVLPRAIATELMPWVGRERPDLAIVETGDPGAALAAHAHGVPVVVHSFGRRGDPGFPMGGRVGDGLAAVAADLGVEVPAVGHSLGHAYLDVCPPSLQAPPVDGTGGPREVALRPTPWNPAVPFTPTGHARPWVYLTLGTAMGDADVLRRTVAGLARLDVDVLLATGSVAVGELADVGVGAVRVEPFVPQADLLGGRLGAPPALVVHHGGSGTTLATAAAGVPHLVLPQGADQFANADALTGLGVGRSLVGPAAADVDALVGAARALLADGPERAAARALAVEIAAMPAPADVAARLPEWAS